MFTEPGATMAAATSAADLRTRYVPHEVESAAETTQPVEPPPAPPEITLPCTLTLESMRRLLQGMMVLHSPVEHHLASYNQFLSTQLPAMLKELNRVVVATRTMQDHVLTLSNPYIGPPSANATSGLLDPVTPQDVKDSSLSYRVPVFVHVRHEIFQTTVMPGSAAAVAIAAAAATAAPTGPANNNGNPAPPPPPPTWVPQCARVYGHRLSCVDYPNVLLVELPVPVYSIGCALTPHPDPHRHNLCDTDLGGYFLINGREKVIVSQIARRPNCLLVVRSNKNPQVVSKFAYELECRSWNDCRIRSTSTLVMYYREAKGSNPPKIVLKLPYLMQYLIPLATIFRLIGVTTLEERRRLILGSRYADDQPLFHRVTAVLHDEFADQPDDKVYKHIAQHGSAPSTYGGVASTRRKTDESQIRGVRHIMQNEFLPHLGLDHGDPEILLRKRMFLARMVRKLLLVVLERVQPDDRDHVETKRVHVCGHLAALRVRQELRNTLKQWHMNLKKLLETGKFLQKTMLNHLSGKLFTMNLQRSWATGHWGVSRTAGGQSGVVQMRQNMSPQAGFSHMKRVTHPLNKEGKDPVPRQLHLSAFGVIDPCETPEGTTCGLVTALSLQTLVRQGTPTEQVVQTVLMLPHVRRVSHCTSQELADAVLVLVNGVVTGMLEREVHHRDFMEHLREMRRASNIPYDTSIAWNPVEEWVDISSDTGCLLRPLLALDRLDRWDSVYQLYRADPVELWRRMLLHGVIEYIDKTEERDLLVAATWAQIQQGTHEPVPADETDTAAAAAAAGSTTTKWRWRPYTHAALSPELMLGICSSLIPFPDYNQAPRNAYQSAMGKQAVGKTATNEQARFDSKAFSLCYPQRPLITTYSSQQLGLDELPTVVNCTVLIGTIQGLNVDDAVVFSQQFADLAGFDAYVYETYVAYEVIGRGDKEEVIRPDPKVVKGMRKADYSHLQPNGLPRIGSVLTGTCAIIGMVIHIDQGKNKPVLMRDQSVLTHYSERQVVDAIQVIPSSRKEAGERLVRVRTRCYQPLRVGDKFSSRHGQKGVIGQLIPIEDLPHTSQGITPDILVNPHALPSRMTIGHMVEMLAGKAAALEGCYADGTSFASHGCVEQLGDCLHRHGYARSGNEAMYDGRTGKKLEGAMYLGVIPYQRLYHLVLNKFHTRGRGPCNLMTRQPTQGRQREGGLRFGEMERDTLFAHGVGEVLTDRLCKQSDPFNFMCCRKCGTIGQRAPPADEWQNAAGMQYQTVVDTRQQAWCRVCQSSEYLYEVEVPYPVVLLMWEMAACGVDIAFQIEPTDNTDEPAVAGAFAGVV